LSGVFMITWFAGYAQLALGVVWVAAHPEISEVGMPNACSVWSSLLPVMPSGPGSMTLNGTV
jgi:hypothetical protein